MKVHVIACVLATVTGICAGAEDWKDRRLKQRSPLDASPYATEVSCSSLSLGADSFRWRHPISASLTNPPVSPISFAGGNVEGDPRVRRKTCAHAQRPP